MNISITVCWFGPLREHRGCAEELVNIAPTSVAACAEALLQRHQLHGASAGLTYAIDARLVRGDHQLQDGDRLALLPLVSGG